MSLPSKVLPKITDQIKQIKSLHIQHILRSTEEYLTPLSLRSIVDYILELEEKNGG